MNIFLHRYTISEFKLAHENAGIPKSRHSSKSRTEVVLVTTVSSKQHYFWEHQ